MTQILGDTTSSQRELRSRCHCISLVQNDQLSESALAVLGEAKRLRFGEAFNGFPNGDDASFVRSI